MWCFSRETSRHLWHIFNGGNPGCRRLRLRSLYRLQPPSLTERRLRGSCISTLSASSVLRRDVSLSSVPFVSTTIDLSRDCCLSSRQVNICLPYILPYLSSDSSHYDLIFIFSVAEVVVIELGLFRYS